MGLARALSVRKRRSVLGVRWYVPHIRVNSRSACIHDVADCEKDFDLDDDGHFTNVRVVAERLDEAYEPTNLGNKDDPFEELVYVVLSTRTRESYYKAAFQRVKETVGCWNDLPETDTAELEKAIGSAGLAAKKAETLKAAAAQIREREGEVSLDFLRDVETHEADLFLRGLPGVGTKTARCILMYALDRPVFPMDTHCRRIGNRLGWFDAPSRRISLGRLRKMEAAIPEDLRKQLHVRQIQHGRSVCLAKEPDCESCVIREFCKYYHVVK